MNADVCGKKSKMPLKFPRYQVALQTILKTDWISFVVLVGGISIFICCERPLQIKLVFLMGYTSVTL